METLLMKRKIVLILLIPLAYALFASCEHTAVNPVQRVFRELTPLEKSLVESDNKFGLKLFREVNHIETDKTKNVFISPLSVSMALGMTLNGANGGTLEAMQETLELAGLTTEEINQSYKSLIELLVQLDPQVKFKIANSIWHKQDYAFEQQFIDLNRTFFNAVVRALNFADPAAKDIINGWVKENTNNLIDKIIEEIRPDHVMFLINAIYFKGDWTYQFDPANTADDFFATLDGSTKPCKMMHLQGDFSYFDNASFQAIDLPYGDAGFSMTILLPRVRTQIDSLVAALTPENWAAWMAGFSTQKVDLAMPKFTTQYEIKLNDVLAALGMGIAFTDLADFTRMYAPGGLAIDEVKHKTFVKVDEEGTEAAAVTSVGVVETSLPQIISMRIDHPFVFAIRENRSQTILFIGKIAAPES
jgi:serpin B